MVIDLFYALFSNEIADGNNLMRAKCKIEKDVYWKEYIGTGNDVTELFGQIPIGKNRSEVDGGARRARARADG